MAMETISRNTVFTNVAETSDGGVFWEGLEGEVPRTTKIKSWLGVEDWHAEQGKPAAHPNSRSVHSPTRQIYPSFCKVVTCRAWSDVGFNVSIFHLKVLYTSSSVSYHGREVAGSGGCPHWGYHLWWAQTWRWVVVIVLEDLPVLSF